MTINYVTFHKVEFSDKNTRVYLTVENLNKKASVGFYDYDAKAMQGKKQYAKTYSFDVTYPEIKSAIPAGIKEDGVILFEPLNYNLPSARFEFQATRQDTYDTSNFMFLVGIPTFDNSLDTKTKWTEYNSTLGVSLEYPSSWNLNSTDNSLSDPVNGNIFLIALSNETIPIDIKTLSDEIRAQNSSDMIEPFKMSNYTIDGEPSAEGIRRLIEPVGVFHQKEILTRHDGKIYTLFFASYPTEVAKPETKEILDHIIKSIRWTSP